MIITKFLITPPNISIIKFSYKLKEGFLIKKIKKCKKAYKYQ